MNALIKVPYEMAWRAAGAIAPLVPASRNKILRTLRSRVNLMPRLDAWAGAYRETSRPLVWMHASSVGESLQALPVLKLLKERKPGAQIVFTFYSPSAESASRTFPADFVSYLPFDAASSMRHALNSLRPTALVFSKLDVWPTLVDEARRAGVKTGIISATLHAESGRRSTMASLLLRDAYAALDSIGAISDEDRANVIQLGASENRVTVTGDTRYDQVWERRQGGGPGELLDHLRSTQPTVVAGSTWKSDEVVLFRAFIEARKTHRRLRLIIAPHEPSGEAVQAIQNWAAHHSLKHALLDDPSAASADIVIVNRIGVLGDLYVLADIAFVGGGFHRPGLHSVLEPAAFAKPVVFGSPFDRTRDAEILVEAGAARGVQNANELHAVLANWLTDSTARGTAGVAGETAVKKGLGAAEASYHLVEKLLATGA